jgi:hypothetical protein
MWGQGELFLFQAEEPINANIELTSGASCAHMRLSGSCKNRVCGVLHHRSYTAGGLLPCSETGLEFV